MGCFKYKGKIYNSKTELKEAIKDHLKADIKSNANSNSKMKLSNFIADDFIKSVRKMHNFHSNKNSNERQLENNIYDTHETIYSNPNKKIQRKINKVLSIEFAKKQGELFSKLNESKRNKHWTPYSSTYQRYKMMSASIGKAGIGSYSNALVFNSMVQQHNGATKDDSKKIRMTGRVYKKRRGQKKGEHKIGNIGIQIGNIKSDGIYGKLMSLDGSRSIADMFIELQNIATDNENEQIMNKLGVNKYTMNVQVGLTLLGFDKVNYKGDDFSIPALIISQPIIKEYVRLLEKNNSKTVGFNRKSKEKIAYELLYKKLAEKRKKNKALKKKYNINGFREKLTGKYLVEAIKNNADINSDEQLAVLQLFLEQEGVMKEISKFNTKFNLVGKTLGVSHYDVLDKHSALANILDNPLGGENVGNLNNLVFKSVKKYKKNKSIGNGVVFGNVVIEPKNATGAMHLHAVKSAYNLTVKEFPFEVLENEIFVKFDEILNKENMSEFKSKDTRDLLLKEYKKYLYSNSELGLFEDPVKERYRLAINDPSNGKISLAAYMNNIISNGHLKDIELVKGMVFQNEELGEFSLIRYSQSSDEIYSDEKTYNSLIELLTDKKKLPDFNGKPYNTAMLAEDLIRYAYLEGGVQEAIQFVKYIPVELLTKLPFARKLNNITNSKNLGMTKEDVDSFVLQFFQHNPMLISNNQGIDYQSGKVDTTRVWQKYTNKSVFDANYMRDIEFLDDSNELFDNVASFKYKVNKKNNEFQPELLTVKSSQPESSKKFLIFKHVGKGKYIRVSNLGAFGMSEYNYGKPKATSVIHEAIEISPYNMREKINNLKPPFEIGLMDTKDVLKNIIDSVHDDIANPILLLLSNELIPEGLEIEVSSMQSGSKFEGAYDFINNKIYVHPNVIKKGEEYVAKVILKELTHSATVGEMRKYFNPDSSIKEGVKLPNSMKDLHTLFVNYRSYVNETQDNAAKDYQKGDPMSKGDKLFIYPATDIFEFVEVMFTEAVALENLEDSADYFKDKYSEKAYKKQFVKKGLWNKFKSFIKNFLNNLMVNTATKKRAITTILEVMSLNSESSLENDGNSLRKLMKKTNHKKTKYSEENINFFSPEEEFVINSELGVDIEDFKDNFKDCK